MDTKPWAEAMEPAWLSDIAEYPDLLRLPYQELQKEETPYRQVRRLLDCFESFLKFLVFCSLQSLRQSPDLRQRMTGFLAGKICRPLSLGTWQECLDALIDLLPPDRDCLSSDLLRFYGHKKHKGTQITPAETHVFSDSDPYDTRFAPGAVGAFVAVRNRYAHTPVFQNTECVEHFSRLLPVFNSMLEQVGFLKRYSLHVNGHEDAEPYLMHDDGDSYTLYPLVIWRNNSYYSRHRRCSCWLYCL